MGGYYAPRHVRPMTEENPKTADAPGTAARLWPRMLVFPVIIAGWYGLSRVIPLEIWLLDLLARVEGYGIWGPFIFILIYVPCCLLMFPDVLPNAAAGAIWGVGVGSVAVLFGRVLGSAATFLLVRHVAGRWIARRMAADAGFAAVSEAVGREGFRIVVLLRLCPLFPVIMLNYALGLTRVSLTAYAAGTFFGMIPRTVFVAYAGSGARSVAGLATGGEMDFAVHPVLYWAGLAASLTLVVVLAHTARRLIKESIG